MDIFMEDIMHCDFNFTEDCSCVSNCKLISIGAGGLVSWRRQAIIRTNVDQGTIWLH